jgi:hypothetical protein
VLLYSLSQHSELTLISTRTTSTALPAASLRAYVLQ